VNAIEKFRAQAALYSPSTMKGDGWIEISGPDLGGEAIIQLQEDARRKSRRPISVVRFQFRHGKDFLNARIQSQLPIHQKGATTVLFKPASSSNSGFCRKTVYLFKFENIDDTDDFMMWWLAKNGSTFLGEETKKTSKRKTRNDCNDGGTGFTPQKKKSKPSTLGSKARIPLKGSTNAVPAEGTLKLDNVTKSVDKDTKKLGGDSDSDSDDNEEIDYDCAPLSQNWQLAFDPADYE